MDCQRFIRGGREKKGVKLLIGLENLWRVSLLFSFTSCELRGSWEYRQIVILKGENSNKKDQRIAIKTHSIVRGVSTNLGAYSMAMLHAN